MTQIRSRCKSSGRFLTVLFFLAGVVLGSRPAAPAGEPSAAGAEPKAIFTIEVATFPDTQKEAALTTARSLEQQEFPNVRVELITRLLSVRVGVYETRIQGLPTYKKLLLLFPKSQLRTAFLMPERIVYPKPVIEESTAAETVLQAATTEAPADRGDSIAPDTGAATQDAAAAEATAAETAAVMESPAPTTVKVETEPAVKPAPAAAPAPASEQVGRPAVTAGPVLPATPATVNPHAVFTIQVASFARSDKEIAIQTASNLEQKGFPNVRVELIGSLYTVRVGAWETGSEGTLAYRKIHDSFPTSILRTGYLIPARVVYPESTATQPVATEAAPAAASAAQSPEPAVSTAPDTATVAEPAPTAATPPAEEAAPAAEPPAEVFTIQVASCSTRAKSSAINIARRLEAAGFTDVRVELINNVYAVRAGAYATKEEATPWHQKARRMFPRSVIRTAYLLPERIVYPEQPAPEEATTPETSVLKPVAQAAPVIEEIIEPEIYPELPLLRKRLSSGSSLPLDVKQNRVEFTYGYEYLIPNDSYGTWQSAHVIYTRQQTPTFAYLVDLGNYWRMEDGNGSVVGLGVYKTWKPNFFTYSAVSFGTDVGYLSAYRFDTDLNFKLGNKRNYVWQIGGSYVKSHNEHSDIILDTGLVVYLSKWIFSYKLNRNQSNPGAVIAYSHNLGVEYGMEGWQWLAFTVAFGKGAYLATEGLVFPEEVEQNSFYLGTHLRRWLRPHFGITGDINYVNLQGGYDKYGTTIGIFQEF